MEPQEIAEQFSQTARQHPPRPTVPGRDDERSDEKPARRPNGNTRSRYDCERLSEPATQDIGHGEKKQGQGLGAVRPDARHWLLLPDQESLGTVSASYSTCAQYLDLD